MENCFVERFTALRAEANASYQTISEKTGVSLRALKYYGSGEREPTMAALRSISEYFNVPVGCLVGKAGANLTKANLSRADMREVKACGAIFVEANLSGTDLRNADLRWADFTHANLRGALLEGAKLEGAVFTDADVTGTLLDGKMINGRFSPLASND